MGFLAGKRFLITGVLSNRSIAYGVAKACRREGAELAFSYQGERFQERVAGFASEFDSKLLFDLDVAEDSQIERTFAQLGETWPEFDGFVHSIGFARDRLARVIPDRPRHLELQLPRAGQGRAAPPAAWFLAAHADLSRRAPQRAELQHHGSRKGVAGSQRPLPGCQPRRPRCPGERHLGRTDQDAGGA